MKKGKRVKPKFPIEYRLLITLKYNEREKKTVVLVALRTVNEFTNFLYEIIVQDTLNNDVLHLRINGLRAPQVSLPGMGPAKFQKEYEGLNGTFTVIVTKLDRMENIFVVNISEKLVTIVKSPKMKFVEFVTNEQDW